MHDTKPNRAALAQFLRILAWVLFAIATWAILWTEDSIWNGGAM